MEQKTVGQAGQTDKKTDKKAEKRRLRQELKSRVNALSEDYCIWADRAIGERLFALESWRQAGSVFCYAGAGREIDTWSIIDRALAEGKTTGVPLCTAPGIMEARQITGRESLALGHFGIQEPKKECPLMRPENFDLVIVPGLSFTRDGFRLGYGGGYYDRYLPRVKGLKLALCRENCLSSQLPSEPHDVRMDAVITEHSTNILNHSVKV